MGGAAPPAHNNYYYYSHYHLPELLGSIIIVLLDEDRFVLEYPIAELEPTQVANDLTRDAKRSHSKVGATLTEVTSYSSVLVEEL